MKLPPSPPRPGAAPATDAGPPRAGPEVEPEEEATTRSDTGQESRPATRSKRPEAAKLTPGAVIGDRYELVKFIAAGGMGSVWEARDVDLERAVAIKFMDCTGADADEYRTRFRREARAAAKMGSRHVVQVFDHGTFDDIPFIVMELLVGEDLKQRLRRVTRLSLVDAANLLTQVCRAVRLAHEAGLIHRDLKPGNVFFARTKDGDEVIKVLDFGIAKLSGDDSSHDTTATGAVVGSPHYMSPEQGRALKSTDHRSDLFSLGMVMFHAVTGERAFVGESAGDLIYKICSIEPRKPSSIVPELPASVDAFFAKALQKEPADRFQTAAEMAQAFEVVVGLPPSIPNAAHSSPGPLFSLADGSAGQMSRESLPDVPSNTALGAYLPAARRPDKTPLVLAALAAGVVGTAIAAIAFVTTREPDASPSSDASSVGSPSSGSEISTETTPSDATPDGPGTAAAPTASAASSAASAPSADASAAPDASAAASASASSSPPPPTWTPKHRGKPLFGRH